MPKPHYSFGGTVMKAPQIRMESQFAKIGMNQRMSKIYMQQKKADLTIKQSKATVEMEIIPSKLTIDQTEAWEQMNLKSTARMIEEYAKKGSEAVLEGMARKAEQGDELMRIEKSGNPIVSQAIQNGHRQSKRLGITFIPEPFSVKINYEPSQLHIHVQPNPPIIEAIPNRPEIEFERGQLNIYMEQYEQLHIDVAHLFSETV